MPTMPRLIYPVIVVAILIATLKFIPTTPNLPRYGEVPQFTLTDTSGKEYGSKDLQGHVWMVNFFFSSCQMVCPAINGRISKIAHSLSPESPVRIVSISIDPETDTPSVLSEYAKRFVANPDTWKFLTGDAKIVNMLTEGPFMLGKIEDINFHSTRVILIDSKMQIRGFYRGDENDGVEALRNDLEKLTKE